jgi:hypothetical protein
MGQSNERWPWYDTPYWEEARARFEQIAEQEGDAVARADIWFELYSLQLLFALNPFRLIAKGRPPGGADGWLATWSMIEALDHVIEASAPLAAVGFGPEIERNRQIVRRTLQVSEEWIEGVSEQEREAARSQRRRLMVPGPPPPSCSTKRGQRRPWGDRSKELGHKSKCGQRDFFLQHPRDNDFRRARPGIEDAALLQLVDAWIEDWQRNYRELVSQIPPACVDHGELVFEAVAEGVDYELVTGVRSPATMRLQRTEKGKVANSEEVATDLLVLEDGPSPQPDGIAMEPGERWCIQGHRLSDGTIMPCWGTHRIARSEAFAPAAPEASS